MTFIVHEVEILLHKLFWVFLIILTNTMYTYMLIIEPTCVFDSIGMDIETDTYLQWNFSAIEMNKIVAYRKVGVSDDNHIK